ncbi:sn-glycerol-3-phosphate ABC transporter ATP-binding protein UgpC [Arsenicitalea aurantiaca]|uniref:sn-glycerol-3-phosphate ABC transporter ATP-binding protein UgpC n=1 Tax=Arsenicitalea aurantiaca TaxID=1783274 RepID=A0A433X3D1_9HYPH|nr:sn-glycerol-3-phosphate ABC transporter ATP-binding protein UgpC [Arsenicitalea aurantiaca]RUT28566.1 sn-glycerol-3-phosphate ABC transporter ATP-binding protein UgpC [Arsenicitalea aurantiaca]
MAPVSLRGLGKSYDGQEAVRGIDLEIAEHEFVVLVGPSGCGKSTTLRMIAGLETISSGELRIGDRVVNALPPGERDVAMVFQNYALYPHMTVGQNIAFGLRRRNLSRQQVREAVADAARLLEIEPLLKRRPGALSGGQRQRVAMGRAIVRRPKVFLFDEPLSNLDARLRTQMRTEIKRLHQEVPTTTIYVTHDQVEAMTMADRVVVMKDGAIEQVGPPLEVYRNPRTRFVAEFIGSPAMNFFDGRLVAEGDGLAFRMDAGPALTIPPERRAAYGPIVGEKLTLGLRPEALAIVPRGETPHLAATTRLVEPLGVETLVYFDAPGASGCARLSPDRAPRAGEPIALGLDPAMMHLIRPDTGAVVPWN